MLMITRKSRIAIKYLQTVTQTPSNILKVCINQFSPFEKNQQVA